MRKDRHSYYLETNRIKHGWTEDHCYQCGWPFDPGDVAFFAMTHDGDHYDGQPFCGKRCIADYYRQTAKHVSDALAASGAIA